MLSASPRGRLQLATGFVWSRTRQSLGGGVLWSALLVFLLSYALARSTVTAGWVPGIEVVTLIVLGAAVLMGLMAVLPVPWPAALGLGMLLGPVVAVLAAAPAIHNVHPLDPMDARLIDIWWKRITDGSASTDTSFYLFLISWLMWVTGAWLSWCVLRWRKPMLGLIPGAAAFATNLLNIPPGSQDQNGYTLAILVLTLALLLWTNYTASIASAMRARVKLTGDARWDFWESGLVAMAALIVLGIMLPPLSTVDRTAQMESGAFQGWAQLQQRLNHAGTITNGSLGGGTTGFTTDVKLGGALVRTRDPVFTYTIVGDFAGPRYFRGVNATLTAGGEWRYPATTGLVQPIHKNQIPFYAEDYQKLAVARFDVTMLRPPSGNPDIVFHPGELYRLDRETAATEVLLPVTDIGLLYSIDRLSSVSPPTSTGKYKVTVEYSTASQAELEAAGTKYPDWVKEFSTLPSAGYRSTAVINKIHQLALKIVSDAGAVTPYDKAAAIESYLRNTSNYTYKLDPPATPAGRDPLEYFLFSSKQGYCEFFASAMGDMLRSLGIPTRLVNGFGPGQIDTTTGLYVVRGEDAHTWVESYFPGYGWIGFEPTPDGVYYPASRGAQGSNLCLRDNNCDVPTEPSTGTVGLPVGTGRSGGRNDPGALAGGGSTFVFHAPDAGTLTKVVGLLLALLLVLLAVVARYLRPRTVMGVWKRTLSLASLAGAERRPGETPLELSRRLQRSFPEASEPVGSLAEGFVISAYAPPELASSARSSVLEAWSSLRPLLLRRVFARFRPSRY